MASRPDAVQKRLEQDLGDERISRKFLLFSSHFVVRTRNLLVVGHPPLSLHIKKHQLQKGNPKKFNLTSTLPFCNSVLGTSPSSVRRSSSNGFDSGGNFFQVGLDTLSLLNYLLYFGLGTFNQLSHLFFFACDLACLACTVQIKVVSVLQ